MLLTPTVSIIVNCYNGERYLREALDSVIKQSYTDWELIFWDNRSSDNSRLICESYNDPRIRYFFSDSHTVLYAARNRALAECRGEFICFLDVDDWWTSDHLDRQLACFDDPNVGLACGNYWVVNELRNTRKIRFDSPVPSGLVMNSLLADYFVALPTLMIRSSAIATLTHPFNDKYHIIGEFDLVMRLSIKWHLEYLQTPIAFYRVHGENESTRHRQLQVEELEHWQSTPVVHQVISKASTYPVFQNFVIYKMGISAAINRQRLLTLRCSNQLPWGRDKLALIIVALAPRRLINWISKRA